MSNDEDWGPWIEHAGKGCPCVGMWVRAVFERRKGEFVEREGRAGSDGALSWDWENYGRYFPEHGVRAARVIRYRIRRPKALRDLIDMAENLPQPERVDV